MIQLIKKYKEQILYLIFGGLTTLVNVITYFVCRKLNASVTLSTIVAWFVAVLFAYITNKLFVFESKCEGSAQLLHEIIGFFGCRLFTGLLDLGIMYVSVDILNFNELVMKILSNIIVIALNYIFSKLVIFNRNSRKEKE
jgi:putative flippase GtrA